MRTMVFAICAGVVLLAQPVRADDSNGTTIEDPTLFGGGIALASVGGASSLAGLVLVAIVAPIDEQFAFFGSKPDVSGYYEVGVPLLVAGVLMTVGGVAMAVEGGHEVPRVAFAPFVSPRGASVGIVGTF